MALTGPIQTLNPSGQPFGADWSAISQWDGMLDAASGEFGTPFDRSKGHIVIESQGDQSAIQQNDSNGWSYGLMQIVPVGVGWSGWGADVVRLSGRTDISPTDRDRLGQLLMDDPLLNLRVGCSILRIQYDTYGSWDQASSAFFLGNPSWEGVDTVNGNTGDGYRRSLNELILEIQAGGTGPPPPSGDYVTADIVRTTEVMNLRNGPGSGATVIGSLPRNAILILEGPSDFRDGAWWFQHRSHWGYGWSTDRFTEYGDAPNFSRNPSGAAGPLTGIRGLAGATLRYTASGHVRVDCPDGRANAGVEYVSAPNLNVDDGRSVIALWDLLGLFGNNYDFIARYRDGTTDRVGGPYAGSAPDGAAWKRNYSTILTLNGSKVCDELLFRMKNQGSVARVFHIDNVDFISV